MSGRRMSGTTRRFSRHFRTAILSKWLKVTGTKIWTGFPWFELSLHLSTRRLWHNDSWLWRQIDSEWPLLHSFFGLSQDLDTLPWWHESTCHHLLSMHWAAPWALSQTMRCWGDQCHLLRCWVSDSDDLDYELEVLDCDQFEALQWCDFHESLDQDVALLDVDHCLAWLGMTDRDILVDLHWIWTDPKIDADLWNSTHSDCHWALHDVERLEEVLDVHGMVSPLHLAWTALNTFTDPPELVIELTWLFR